MPTSHLSLQTGAPAARPSHSLHVESRPVRPELHHDTLQVAAQVQSWLFMQSNLQECLSMVQKGVQVHRPVVLTEKFIADFPRTPIMLSQKSLTTLAAPLDPMWRSSFHSWMISQKYASAPVPALLLFNSCCGSDGFRNWFGSIRSPVFRTRKVVAQTAVRVDAIHRSHVTSTHRLAIRRGTEYQR